MGNSDTKIKRDFLENIVHREYYSFLKNELKQYIQHGSTSTFVHSRDVAFMAYLYAKKHHLDKNPAFSIEDLVLSGFCHDFFMYDWHERIGHHKLHGFTHAHVSAMNAYNYCHLSEKALSIIETHMWPLTITKIPRSKEAWIICMIDKLISLKEIIHR